jgi:hypothetical protein
MRDVFARSDIGPAAQDNLTVTVAFHDSAFIKFTPQ